MADSVYWINGTSAPLVDYTITTTSGSGWVYSSPNITVQAQASQPDVCASGHRVGEIAALSDEFVGACVNCGEVILLEGVPGGLPTLLMRRLLEAAVAGEWDGDNYVSLVSVRERLRAEREALALAEAEFGILEKIVSPPS